jgi:hypothetical protein
MFSVAAGLITVRPLPSMVPPVQFMVLPTVTVSAPPRPPFKSSVAGATVPVPSKLAVPPEMSSKVLLTQV